MASRFAVLGVVASALLLAGCAPQPAIPVGLSVAETQAIIDRTNAVMWAGMFPDEPMPIVDPIKTASPKARSALWQGCILDANLPGVFVTYEGSVSFTATDNTDMDAFHRQSFICELEYPPDPSNPEELGYLSDGQLRYLYGYYTTRLVPCLRSIGFTLRVHPSLGTYLQGGGTYWLPYYDMVPVPTSEAEWDSIDLRCPPPPFFADARPGKGFLGPPQ
ncbi:MAG: hypothetical protein ABI632_09300 [Pseudolysinimonas sp.]